MPMKFLFKPIAAIAVVPLPENGSSIICAVVEEMIRSIRAKGNGAGYKKI